MGWVRTRRPAATIATLGLTIALVVAAVPTAGLAGAQSSQPGSATTPAPIEPGLSAPTDPDGDGTYEDLSGNGDLDFRDVVAQFSLVGTSGSAVGYYDFTDNGELDYQDVVRLFASVDPGTGIWVADGVGADGNATVGEPVRFRADRKPQSVIGGRTTTIRFGDGTTATGTNVTHTFEQAGTYAVTATVTDDAGRRANATETVTVVPADGARDARDPDRTIAYYTSWARYQRGYMPSDVPLDRITHLNYAFLDVTPNGTVVLGDQWGDRQNLEVFRNRSRNHPETTFLLSIGGWSYSDDFSEAASTEARRERFARTAIAKMRKYDFDGIDVDWEYPGGGGKAGNTVGADDPHNFTLLIEELRRQLDAAERADGRNYSLTMAVSADPTKATRLEVGAVADDVDAVNVMSYDYHGAWSDRTNHNAPLYAPPDDPSSSGLSVNRSMQFWADQPIAREKLSVGVPFYGRGFSGVAGSNDGLYQSFTGTPSGTYGAAGVYEYWDVATNLNASGSGYQFYWDDRARVGYLYSTGQERWISVPTPRSVRAKTRYAEREGFGGVMVWALSHDKNESLLPVIQRTQRIDAAQ